MNDETLNNIFRRIPLATVYGYTFVLWHRPNTPDADVIVVKDGEGNIKGLLKNVEGEHME